MAVPEMQHQLAVFLHQCDAAAPQPLTDHERIHFEHQAELILDWVIAHGGFSAPDDPDEEACPDDRVAHHPCPAR